MRCLKMNLQLPTTSTNISYEIKEKLATALLQTFLKSKLLHAPEDKTRDMIKRGLLLQPTPKGVAILHSFVKRLNPIPNSQLPPILKSNLNSMELICFERSSRTDSIICSEYWIKLLFMHLMGPKMNFWSSKNQPDQLPKLQQANTNNQFSFPFGFNSDSNNSQMDFLAYLNEKRKSSMMIQAESPVESIINIKDEISPFHHKYFTNPDSDSHVQYYTSDTGVRLFKNKIIKKPDGSKLLINHCFSGKAVVQWLMDCTDVMHQEEGIAIATLILRAGLIYMINPSDLEPTTKMKFQNSRDALYTLTADGFELVRWNERTDYDSIGKNAMTSVHELSKGDSNLALKEVLNDPGAKYLFKRHLEEELATENLDVFDEIQTWEKKVNTLKNLLKLKEKEKLTNELVNSIKQKRKLTIRVAVFKLYNDCMSRAYSIYTSYLTQGAPYEVNINSQLKLEINKIMTNTDNNATTTDNNDVSFDIPVSTNEFTTSGPSAKPTLDLTKFKLIQDDQGSSLSPTDYTIAPMINILIEIQTLFEEVKNHLFQSMEKDSLPKFLNSAMFKEVSVARLPKKS
ncbi:hypothetical protein CANARDRAFT_239192 [[Candida] arabinofermentans NRRL YB-2248]|uniref:Uncharacterized protein n=1 Tax=[Candida] arabinofermentans NRRL YB-2248 TaxID=983967 RepID=A0A1E4STP9_9ASCO|nr:hypothetical protein CANARDRAFT_239192 [[Candida] arabinofermentans NRRL YB-2248]